MRIERAFNRSFCEGIKISKSIVWKSTKRRHYSIARSEKKSFYDKKVNLFLNAMAQVQDATRQRHKLCGGSYTWRVRYTLE
jgi:hypothetical protein